MKQLKIPMSRIPVLIGHDGEMKKLIEEKAGIRFDVNSTNGDVTIYDDIPEEELVNPENQRDPLISLKIEYLVKAIARGFSPENALLLLQDDMYYRLIDIRDYSGKSRNAQHRVKARIIGEDGKTREVLEDLSGCKVAISGYSVSLIGDYYSIEIATTAVDMLLHGARHAQAYSFLEKKKREMANMKMPEF